MYRYLADIWRRTLMLFPSMLYVTAKQSNVIIAQHLDVVAHDAARSLAVFHKVELHLLMAVHRICVLLLVSLHEMVAIFLGEACDF